MLYTIHGFQQSVLLEFECDLTDALFLRWFADFIHTGKMETFVEGETVFYWVSHQYAIMENPIMRIRSVEAFSRRLRRMEQVGLLFSRTVKEQKRTKKFYRFNPEAFDRLTFHTQLKSRVSNQANSEKSSHPTFELSSHPTQKLPNSSTKEDSSIRDSSKKEEEEDVKPKVENQLSEESLKKDSRGAKEKKKEEEERVRAKKMKTLLRFTERGATPTTSRARLQAQARQLREGRS